MLHLECSVTGSSLMWKCTSHSIEPVGQVQPEEYFYVICYLFPKEGVNNVIRTDTSCSLHLPLTSPTEILRWNSLKILTIYFLPSLHHFLPQCLPAAALVLQHTPMCGIQLWFQRGPSIHLANEKDKQCSSFPFSGMLRFLTFQSILNICSFL